MRKTKSRKVEERLTRVYDTCERILLRTILFGWLMLDLGRLVKWLIK